MKSLAPAEATHWFAYLDGILHEGVTEPGQVTCVKDDYEFEHGTDILTKVEKYKAKLRQPNNDHPATPGLYIHNDKVVKLDASDCESKKNTLDAAETKALSVAAK